MWAVNRLLEEIKHGGCDLEVVGVNLYSAESNEQVKWLTDMMDSLEITYKKYWW